MEFKESQTYQNVKKAFADEALAYTKYAIYAEKAKDEGFIQIGNIYNETSDNEKEHAKVWLKLLNDGEIPTTVHNLNSSIEEESYVWLRMYTDFANKAREEGYDEIAFLFEGIGNIEKHHDYRFNSLIQNLKNNKVFCKNKKVLWVCMKCGNLVWDECAPKVCAICEYPQGYYKLNCENY